MLQPALRKHWKSKQSSPDSEKESGNPARSGVFADFQMFSDSRHCRPARQELPARQISANLSRKNRIVS